MYLVWSLQGTVISKVVLQLLHNGSCETFQELCICVVVYQFDHDEEQFKMSEQYTVFKS